MWPGVHAHHVHPHMSTPTHVHPHMSTSTSIVQTAAEVATFSVSIQRLRPAIVSAFERHPAEWAAANGVIGGSVDEALVGFASVYNLIVREPGGNLPDQNGDKQKVAHSVSQGNLARQGPYEAPTVEVITALCRVCAPSHRGSVLGARAWRAAMRSSRWRCALSELS